MSVEATTAAWARRDVTSTEKLVLVRIADHAGPDGSDAWPSVARLMRDTGLSERAVQCAVRSLETKGALSRQIGKGPHGTNRYRVSLVPCAPPQQVHPAAGAPPQDVRPSPAGGAPQGGHEVHPNRHLNHQRTVRALVAEGFVAFYDRYPKKIGRGDAEKAYGRAVKRATAEEVSSGLDRAVAFWEAQGTERKFIPNPSTWLNQDRWADVLESGELERLSESGRRRG